MTAGVGGDRDEPPEPQLIEDAARRIINKISSPDVPFDRSINPYRGCEHGCVYCFARPIHAYLGNSPGLDFETKIHYKPNAAMLLRKELAARSYRCAPIALGINADAYQPVERRLGVTREILEVLAEVRHPVSIVTKSALIERDLDLLRPMAEKGLVQVIVSVTTLDSELCRKLEPRAAAPQRRLRLIENLNQAGVPVGVLIAPLIPFLNDSEMEAIMRAVHAKGAKTAGYVLLRLLHELKELFVEWLHAHVPMKAERVLSRLRGCRGGKDYDATFGKRMRGEGVFADLLSQRFHRFSKSIGFQGLPELTVRVFDPPGGDLQMKLF